MENKFCFLNGLVECESGRIQDCNNQRVKVCPLKSEKQDTRAFCYLKGLVDCEPCDVQDCNTKRVRKCPLE